MTRAGRARLLLVVACVGWGAGFPLMKAVLQAEQEATGAGGTWITAQHQLVRYVGGLALLAALAWWSTRRLPRRGEWAQGVVCGTAAALGMQLQIEALTLAPASTVGFITQFYVLVIPLVMALRARRLPGVSVIASALLALAGVAILSGISPGDLRPGTGELMVLVSSLIFTVQILALEAPRWAANDGLQTSVAMFTVMAVLTLPLVALSGPGLGGVAIALAAPGAAVLTAVIVVACTCMPYAIMNCVQRDVSSTEAGIIYCSEALCAAVASLVLPGLVSGMLGITYPDEMATITMLVGGGLVIAGAVLVQLAPDRSSRPG